MVFREMLRLLVLYTGRLLINVAAVVCVICLHEFIEIRWREHLAGIWKIANKECLVNPNNQDLVQICLLFWCPVGFVLCYPGY